MWYNTVMLPIKILPTILLNNKLLDEAGLKEAETAAKDRRLPLEKFLLQEKKVTEEQLYQAAANYFQLPFNQLTDTAVPHELIEIIPERLAVTHELVPLSQTETELTLACLNPEDLQTIDAVRKKVGKEIKLVLTTPTTLAKLLGTYHASLSEEFAVLNPSTPAETLATIARELPIVRMVDSLLEHAILEHASDIHIEPQEKDVVIRYRIDGILREVMYLPRSTQSGLIARIKVLSNLKLDEHRLPQDGRFKMASDRFHVTFRVSILPVFDGEKATLRVLNEGAQVLNLEQIGLSEAPRKIVQRNIEKPHGMILVTGPTGSGKTTTLYTILSLLNNPNVNISTIEDPVEYRLPHVNQSQVNPKIGFTFALGLRALLRQDPNIIMVGEIRDLETAEVSVNAALTGHLLLSTLHTNNAVASLPRLQEMGVATFLLASTINLIIAQRLVRKICSQCKESYKLPAATLTSLKNQIDLENVLATLVREKIITGKKSAETLPFFHGKGCKECGDTGYRGRLGIYEVLEITKDIRALISQGAPAEKLADAAKTQNMVTLLEDGFMKALQGITTIEEVLRVTKE